MPNTQPETVDEFYDRLIARPAPPTAVIWREVRGRYPDQEAWLLAKLVERVKMSIARLVY